MTDPVLRIGLLINPVAGLGGTVALKGSDGMADRARSLGARSRVYERTAACIDALPGSGIEWFAVAGEMGADLLSERQIPVEIVGNIVPGETTDQDTRAGVSLLAAKGIDLLLFAGGDGTARDVLDGLAGIPAVVGIPSGVKMHSGVFANTPAAAAELVTSLVNGDMLSVVNAEVRDIDESSFREGTVRTRYYGELPVPDDLRYMQQTKQGGREVEGLVIEEMAADFREHQEPGTTYVMGSGSTIAGIMSSLGLEPTLLGIDVIRDGELIAADVTESQLLDILGEGQPAKILVTAISGQGHILGRGNQQLSAEVIRRVGLENLMIVASKSKLAALEGRPLRVDTGDPTLDRELSGLRTVLTGYEDQVFYRVE